MRRFLDKTIIPGKTLHFSVIFLLIGLFTLADLALPLLNDYIVGRSHRPLTCVTHCPCAGLPSHHPLNLLKEQFFCSCSDLCLCMMEESSESIPVHDLLPLHVIELFIPSEAIQNTHELSLCRAIWLQLHEKRFPILAVEIDHPPPPRGV